MTLQIFAAATGNGKLEIWDLSVSSIDPVVLIDTTEDENQANKKIEADLAANSPNNNDGHDANGELKPATPISPLMGATISRFDRMHDKKEESKDPPTVKLLKNLVSIQPLRELTCVQFGERSPILAVGDNYGTVMVYRVIDPVTITHEGPLQQTQKLKSAVNKLVDPSNAAKLSMFESNRREGGAAEITTGASSSTNVEDNGNADNNTNSSAVVNESATSA